MCLRCLENNTEAGFSLIEVLAAMTILSLAASVWLGALMTSSIALREETLRAEAIAIAEGVSALQLSLPSRVCGVALQSALGVTVSDALCATSSCSLGSCAVTVSRSGGSVLVGGEDAQ